MQRTKRGPAWKQYVCREACAIALAELTRAVRLTGQFAHRIHHEIILLDLDKVCHDLHNTASGHVQYAVQRFDAKNAP